MPFQLKEGAKVLSWSTTYPTSEKAPIRFAGRKENAGIIHEGANLSCLNKFGATKSVGIFESLAQ
jgi:hypothetical protein